MLRFILGLVTGVAVGVAAATLTQGESGQDIRAEFDRMRSDLKQGDYDAISSRMETHFADLQTSLEERFGEAQGSTDAASADAADAVAAADAADAAADAAVDAAADASDTSDKA